MNDQNLFIDDDSLKERELKNSREYFEKLLNDKDLLRYKINESLYIYQELNNNGKIDKIKTEASRF